MGGDEAPSGGRIAAKMSALADEGRSAFIAYVMAGDPNREATLAVMRGLPSAGVDIIELGAPFTDPMADGPAIQAAGLRALDAGMTLEGVLDVVRAFRVEDAETPIVMMGYYNPIYSFGVERFLESAASAGLDGLIVVDLPPEEDDELCLPARAAGLDFIRLATPTTDAARLPAVLKNSSGFVYFVSITGVTGAAEADAGSIEPFVDRIKAATDLPVCVGFGVRTPETAEAVAGVADGVVVGSAIVSKIGAGAPPQDVLAFVQGLSDGVRRAKRTA